MSDSLVNPLTHRTYRHERLLSAVMEFSSEQNIISTLLREGVDPRAIMRMAQAIAVTNQGKGKTGLSESQTGATLLLFVGRRNVRKACAAYLARAHGLKPKKALKDLLELKRDLEEEQRRAVMARESSLVVPA